MIVDIHCHVLDDIDDGPKTLVDSPIIMQNA